MDSDSLIPSDKRTMEVIREIGNSTHPSIQLELDYLSNHEEGKMPILDLKVGVQEIDGLHRIIHEFYAKDVLSKAVMFAKSALSWKRKRIVLTQELLRVLLNCSAYVQWERVTVHVNNMILRMQYSVYSKTFWHRVVNAALKAYEEICRKADCENFRCTVHMTGIGRRGTKLRGVKWFMVLKEGASQSQLWIPFYNKVINPRLIVQAYGLEWLKKQGGQ